MVKKRRWLLAAAVLPLILAACTSTTGRQGPGTGTTGTVAGSGSAGPGGLRAVRHVWVIELENQGYAQSFGTPSADPYLARTLPRMGALPEDYYGIGHSSAATYVDYNHYSLLRTIEDIFGLPHLGDAAMPQVRTFGTDVSG